jgi:hypothetical protein
MQNIDKDSFAIILWLLSPSDALSLRATCRVINERIINAQVYWFYKNMEISSGTGARIRVSAHVAPYNNICVRFFGLTNATKLLCAKYPDLEMDYSRRARTLGHQPPGDIWQDDAAHRYWREVTYMQSYFVKENMGKLTILPEFSCKISSHIGYVCESGQKQMQTQHEYMNPDDGFYIYHYLFVCFQSTKNRILKLNKIEPEIRQDKIRSLELKIEQKEQEIKAAKHELSLLKDIDAKYESAKKCPFQRQKPETYHLRKKK